MSTMTRDKVLQLGYDDARQLPDGTWIARGPLLYTEAIFIGITEFSWDKRYCYDDEAKLSKDFDAMQSKDEKLVGWIAQRP